MRTIKDIWNYKDLYGQDLLISALKTNYTHVSFTRNAKTLPKEGSQCRSTKNLKPSNDFCISKLIFHKDGAVTIVTPEKFHFKFINL